MTEMRPSLDFILVSLKVEEQKAETLITFLIKDYILLENNVSPEGIVVEFFHGTVSVTLHISFLHSHVNQPEV